MNNTLAAMAGALLSLLIAYIPGLNTWFYSLSGTMKRAIMAGLIVIVAAGSVAFGCIGVFEQIATSCDKDGAEAMVTAVLASLVANQSTYNLAVKDRMDGQELPD